MGLLRSFAHLGSRLAGPHARQKVAATEEARNAGQRHCRFETMEPRQLLAADLHLGAVYYEPDTGLDNGPDIIEVTFEGGAAGTQLNRITINGDKRNDGMTDADIFFDIADGGLGADESIPLQIISHDGFEVLGVTVVDGGMQLVFDLRGFDAGEKLVFSLDVDEANFVNNDGSIDVSPIVEGREFQRSQISGEFTAQHYEDIQLDGVFWDQYDADFAEAATAAGSTLSLPKDARFENENVSNRTAGAVATAEQVLKPVELSGHVFHDRDNDGVRDAGEEGIANTRIDVIALDTVTGETGTVSVFTDANGFWQAKNLVPGTYKVVEVQPSGWLDGKDAAGQVEGTTVGSAVNPGDEIRDVVLAGGQQGVNYDFGELLPSSISGQVHADPEGDCNVGPNDVLLEGVQIDLFNEQGEKIATTHTDAQGRYRFDNLGPGTYTVFEHQPAGYIDSGDHVGSAGGTRTSNDRIGGITLVSGTEAVDYDFCENIPVALSGHVYHDADNDGVFDPGETGIGGVVVELLDADCNPTGITVTTNAQGYYEFTGLAAGTYGVREVQPSGWLDGLDTPGNRGGTAHNPGDEICEAVLQWGKSGTDYNFGELLASSISGQVHADPEGDCNVGPNDVLLEGVQIDLFNEQGEKLATTHTDAQGRYRFDNLGPGTYTVFEHQPAGYIDSGDHVGSAGGTRVNNDRIGGITLVSGTEAVDYDFCENIPVALSGHVYHDADNDGVFDPGETGIGGVVVELLDADCNPTGITVTTNAQGYYEFTGLAAGTYGVREVQPSGWLDGLDTPGNRGGTAHNPGDEICEAVLQWGKSGTDYNFGELLPGSIRGRVIADTDFDCELDPGEQPLSGVRVDLLDDQGNVLQTAHTNGQGYYEFTGLRPGTYRVYEHQPTTHFHSSQKIGSGGGIVLGQDTVGSIVVGSDQHLVDYNFCEIPPATLAGFVFQDGGTIRTPDGTLPSNWAELRDGQRTSDDRPLAGVVLELRHGVTGEAIRPDVALDGIYSGDAIRVVTDANGYYQFVGLPPGIYAVFEVHPDSYLDGIDTPGTTGGVAVNPHDPVSPLVLSQLTTNPADDAILRIRLTPGQVSVENNFSEVRVEQQPEEVFYPPPERPTYTPGAPPTLGPRPMAVDPPLVQPPLYTYAPWPGRSSVATGYTWHLSVVDAGQPRAMNRPDVLVRLTGTQFDVVAWRGKELDRSSFTWQEGTVKRAVIFGNHEAIPVAGDFNGDGRAEIGVFIKGEWFIDVNGNGVWDEGDLWAKLGHDGDQPVTGDWDADGKTDIGIFGPAWPGDPKAILKEPGLPDPYNVRDENPKNLPPQKEDAALGARTMKLTSTGQLRADLIDHVFHYGTAGDRAVTGDWNGDGIETIAVFRHGRWHLDVDGDGKWTDRDRYAQFGASGDLPVVGDWNGNGVDDLGIYRAGTWYLDTNGNRQIDAADKVFEMGTADDLPIAADFNGEGTDQPGIYRPHGGNAETARR